MQVNYDALLAQTGLDELRGIPVENIEPLFSHASLAGLTDGEMTLVHDEYTHPRLAELFGARNYGAGTVARAVAQTALENGMRETPILGWQTYIADHFAKLIELTAPLDAPRRVHIRPEGLEIDDEMVPLERPPGTVMELGACPVVRGFIGDQMGTDGQPSFAYMPVTALPYVARVLERGYDDNYGPGTADRLRRSGDFAPMVGRLTVATEDRILRQMTAGSPTEVADLVISTHVKHLHPGDMPGSLRNARQLLKTGGMLVLRAEVEPLGDYLSSAQLIDMAMDAGFDPGGFEVLDATTTSNRYVPEGGDLVEVAVRTLLATK